MRRLLVSGVLVLALTAADRKWLNQEYTEWSPEVVARVLQASPWAVQTEAALGPPDGPDRDAPVPLPTPAQSGLAKGGKTGATDGHWDGGVSRMQRGGTPTLPLSLRWESALPVREALLRSHAPLGTNTERTLSHPEKDYILSVEGLVPARHSIQVDGEAPHESSPPDLVSLRRGLLNTTQLSRRDKPPILPEDVRLDEKSGTVTIYFPKTTPIQLEDKEVIFSTVYGAMRIRQRFRLKEMVYNGVLSL